MFPLLLPIGLFGTEVHENRQIAGANAIVSYSFHDIRNLPESRDVGRLEIRNCKIRNP
jgi:hypothetical protein